MHLFLHLTWNNYSHSDYHTHAHTDCTPVIYSLLLSISHLMRLSSTSLLCFCFIFKFSSHLVSLFGVLHCLAPFAFCLIFLIKNNNTTLRARWRWMMWWDSNMGLKEVTKALYTQMMQTHTVRKQRNKTWEKKKKGSHTFTHAPETVSHNTNYVI